MKITNSFNNNFGALFGRKEITTFYNKDGSMKINTIQHIHPFKDEFKTQEDENNWLKDFGKSSFYASQNDSSWGVEKNMKLK